MTNFDPHAANRAIAGDGLVFDPVDEIQTGTEVNFTEFVAESVHSRNWALLARLGYDVETVATWDSTLKRDRRILVPVNVQALVADPARPEPTVPVTGGPGDPDPFSPGVARGAGVHLHWALPDALLRGDVSTDADDFQFPDLPDRWLVLRLMYPTGWKRPRMRGWVIDSAEGSVTPLSSFQGTAVRNEDVPTFDRVDATAGGSLHWTASYEASAGRFGFHDPLDDDQMDTDNRPGRVSYVVAGWASSPERDPLGPTGSGQAELYELLERLRWSATEIPDGEYGADNEDLKRLTSNSVTPTDAQSETVEVRTDGRRERFSNIELGGLVHSFDANAKRIVVAADPPRYSSLFHGLVAGVPVNGLAGPTVDERPSPERIDIAVGLDLNDVVASWAADTWDLDDRRRRSVELVASAFTTDQIDRLAAPDGLRDIEERDHAGSFWSFNGPPLATSSDDRLINTDAAAANPLVMGRRGRSDRAKRKSGRSTTKSTAPEKTLLWFDAGAGRGIDNRKAEKKKRQDQLRDSIAGIGEEEWRRVPKPGPRYQRPQAPVIALRGCGPNPRHLGDGIHTGDGTLKVRFPSQTIDEIVGVVKGSDLVTGIGSGAVPQEIVDLVREAVLIDPYARRWLTASVGAGLDDSGQKAVANRLEAETLLLFSADGSYRSEAMPTLVEGAGDRALSTDDRWKPDRSSQHRSRRLNAELFRRSLMNGVPPSPVAVTTWRQPWIPLWVEWRVALDGTDSIRGWRLDDLDLAPTGLAEPATGNRVVMPVVGRSPLGQGAIKALHGAIERWQAAQNQRRLSIGYRSKRDLVDLGRFLDPLDMASGSLDGIRENLLGIAYNGGLASEPDEDDRPKADGEAHPLFSGRITLEELRLVDGFGRTLDVPVDRVGTTVTLRDRDDARAIRVRPRLQHGSRLLLRLVDPAHRGDPAAAPEAYVDQVDPEGAVNPVAGYLLPDHIDEALEFFDVKGNALGQLSHHELTGAVRWEPAPGRPVAPGSGPLADLDQHSRIAGRLASGVVQADIGTRAAVAGRASEAPTDSALSAFLRAVDTTMWTVDTLAATGTSTVAGLVGRPVAVVRALLRLETPDDLDEVLVASPEVAEQRRAAFERLADQRFPVRLGDLLRSDDTLLGYYVDDDYGRVHLVDGSLVTEAREGGRHRGQLGLLGSVVTPPANALDHPYVSDQDTLLVRPGVTYRLTLLMLPAGKVHVTSGILPRKSIELHDEWVRPGLGRLVPSVRVGPVLVDQAEIRLPKINLLGERQHFTRRTGPLTWRDDPIVAASQAALLPRIPHEIQEGWVRVLDDTTGEVEQ